MPNVIKINPAIFQDKRDAVAVAWNEALRLFMEDNGFTPEFEVTPEQLDFFKDTAYAKDEDAMRKTILARIATRDTSVPNPTSEQLAETTRLLNAVLTKIGPLHMDAPVVKAMLEGLGQQIPESAPGGTASASEVVPPMETEGVNTPETAKPDTESPVAEQLAPDKRATQSAGYAGNVASEPLPKGISDDMGLALTIIAKHEKFSPKPYPDTNGEYAIGHGLHAVNGRKVTSQDTITKEASYAETARRIRTDLDPVARQNIPGWDKMSPFTKAAAYDTAHTAGPDFFRPSKSPNMIRRLRAGEDPQKVFSDEIPTWRLGDVKQKDGTIKKVIIQGLVNRRAEVVAEMLTPFMGNKD
jgi:GH24 family phage-related lysozyme (muramidase)